MKIQVRIKGNQIGFASPLLPNTVLIIDECVDFEKAKDAILNHVKSLAGDDVSFQEIESNHEFMPFVNGIHI